MYKSMEGIQRILYVFLVTSTSISTLLLWTSKYQLKHHSTSAFMNISYKNYNNLTYQSNFSINTKPSMAVNYCKCLC